MKKIWKLAKYDLKSKRDSQVESMWIEPKDAEGSSLGE